VAKRTWGEYSGRDKGKPVTPTKAPRKTAKCALTPGHRSLSPARPTGSTGQDHRGRRLPRAAGDGPGAATCGPGRGRGQQWAAAGRRGRPDRPMSGRDPRAALVRSRQYLVFFPDRPAGRGPRTSPHAKSRSSSTPRLDAGVPYITPPCYSAGPPRPRRDASGPFGPPRPARGTCLRRPFQAAGGSMIMLARETAPSRSHVRCDTQAALPVGSDRGSPAPGSRRTASRARRSSVPRSLGMEAVWKTTVENFLGVHRGRRQGIRLASPYPAGTVDVPITGSGWRSAE